MSTTTQSKPTRTPEQVEKMEAALRKILAQDFTLSKEIDNYVDAAAEIARDALPPEPEPVSEGTKIARESFRRGDECVLVSPHALPVIYVSQAAADNDLALLITSLAGRIDLALATERQKWEAEKRTITPIDIAAVRYRLGFILNKWRERKFRTAPSTITRQINDCLDSLEHRGTEVDPATIGSER